MPPPDAATARPQFRLGLIGYGEVGHALARGLAGEGLAQISALQRLPHSSLTLQRARESGVRLVGTPHELAAASDVLLAVTQGEHALHAAASFASVLSPAHCYADLSSAPPATKRAIAAMLAPSGADFVDGVIEASPLELGHALPLLVSGPGAARFEARVRPWGLRARTVGDAVGQASAIKTLRNILMKGQMALLIEAGIAARACGVTDELFASAAEWYDALPFLDNARRVLRTTRIHAARRAQEAAGAQDLLQELGLEPTMTRATQQVLQRVADLDLRTVRGGEPAADIAEALVCMAAAVRKS